jgi:4-hydroxybenzoate polyprenyltransferase
LPLILSLPVLGFLAAYSLTKRFTRLAHFWLGIALMLAPICAWIALRGDVVIHNWRDIQPVLWLGGIVLFWVAGFDIIYACQDYEFDKQAGLHSIPAKLGITRALLVAKVSHAIMWVLAIGMTFAVPELSLGWLFRLALVVVGGLLVWQHASVSSRSLDRVNFAFFQLNSVISVVFLAVGSVDAWWR